MQVCDCANCPRLNGVYLGRWCNDSRLSVEMMTLDPSLSGNWSEIIFVDGQLNGGGEFVFSDNSDVPMGENSIMCYHTKLYACVVACVCMCVQVQALCLSLFRVSRLLASKFRDLMTFQI